MLPPEIRRGIILPLLDDRAPDRAGAREPVFELVGIAAPDRLLERGQILVEPLQGREHRILVGKKHVAPHHRVARSEEHTSELQSLMRISYAVFCLKKKKLQ